MDKEIKTITISLPKSLASYLQNEVLPEVGVSLKKYLEAIILMYTTELTLEKSAEDFSAMHKIFGKHLIGQQNEE